jgi:hypothetical protein
MSIAPTTHTVAGVWRRQADMPWVAFEAATFVNAELFVVTASVLSVFNVTRAKVKNGNEIPVAAPDPKSVHANITSGM